MEKRNDWGSGGRGMILEQQGRTGVGWSEVHEDRESRKWIVNVAAISCLLYE